MHRGMDIAFRRCRFSNISFTMVLSPTFASTAMTTATTSAPTRPFGPVTALAQQSQRELAASLSDHRQTQRIQVYDERDQAHTIDVPTTALRLLVEILDKIAHGQTVRVVADQVVLTTQQAADMLNVSRPHLIKLLESGALPFHKAGKHRRVHLADVQAYQQQRDQRRQAAMQALADQAQAMDMGYGQEV